MQIELKENYEIKNMTTFKVGGVANAVYFPKNITELIYLLNNETNYIVLGSCSNILFSSQGYDGTIISTSKMSHFEINGTKITADCGVKGPIISKKAQEANLSGFEFMIGFPGSIGGNLFMNAGAHKQWISDTLIQVCVFDKNTNEIIYLSKSDLNFDYRYSILQEGRYIVLSAEFRLEKENSDKIKELMNRNLEFRKDIQPALSYPNAGSVFKNPENDSAGRLLDKAGVKQITLNNVEVWSKHANFIINKGNATSEEILEAMYLMYSKVKEQYTIELKPEIRFIGKINKREEELCRILYKKTQK